MSTKAKLYLPATNKLRVVAMDALGSSANAELDVDIQAPASLADDMVDALFTSMESANSDPNDFMEASSALAFRLSKDTTMSAVA